jgi:phosphoenolpyruvate carboxykinase (ATP)
MAQNLDLSQSEVYVTNVLRNASPARLYEEAIKHDRGVITSTGALLSRSGSKTGRSPKDKRVVEHPQSAADIWWGDINIPLSEQSFVINRQRALDYLNIRPQIYVVDGYAGWDPKYRLKIRIICARPYHALFMHNMLIRPTAEELADFGEPDYVIYNAGEFPANPYTQQMTSKTSIELSFETKEFVILGSEYAGEMKKGIFTIMNYLMPKQGVLSMHCSANEGAGGDVSLFFGLSGTGKTTLSADVCRRLIGDDEHCWSDEGVFNIEGGCYAKCIHLSAQKEPEIFQAIRFGSIIENAVYEDNSRVVNFESDAITENTRVSYPIEYIPNAKIPCIGGHPKNIILLTCDAFGVLPPVSRLTPAQAMYHFISGYTAKVAGTEIGIAEPQATFLVWHPTKYAEMLAAKMRSHRADAWLVNTGWSSGPYGVGSRMKIDYTRAMIDAIHTGELAQAPTIEDPIFGIQIPTRCTGVPPEVLVPWNVWREREAHRQSALKLAALFHKNFTKYEAAASVEVRSAGPRAVG